MVYIREIKWLLHLFIARCMKTVAYLRISTGSQDLANQKLAILDYARQKRFAVDRFIEAQASSREGPGPEADRRVARRAGRGGPPGRQRAVPPGPQPGPGDPARRRAGEAEGPLHGDQGRHPLRGETGPSDQ